MSEYARDVIVLLVTAAALVVAIVVTAQGMAGEPAKGHRPSGIVKELQLPTLGEPADVERLPSMTSKEAHGG